MPQRYLLNSILLPAILLLGGISPALRASDHADGPTVAGDQAADLADCYFFVDPTDATKVVLINTVRGFIVPGEAVNFVVFDSAIKYRFQIENTGDAKPDGFIDVTFSEKVADAAGAALPQTAAVKFGGKLGVKGKFTGTTTNPTLAGTAAPFPTPPQTLKDASNASTNIEFFCGETDDPFFFDIPGFARWRASIVGGMRDDTRLNRGRDTFAGYNVLTIAFRLPIDLLKSTKSGLENPDVIGVNVLAQRQTERTVKGRKVGSGPFTTVDREGLPAVNALLVPLNLKNAYNAATTAQDAKGKFAEPIVASLTALGTDEAHINILASVAVLNGDILRLNTSVPNTGSNPEAAFPNGRRPADDVVKTLLTLINNGDPFASPPTNSIDDSVPANDVPFETVFPYLGLPHQPREGAGNVDDNTRN